MIPFVPTIVSMITAATVCGPSYWRISSRCGAPEQTGLQPGDGTADGRGRFRLGGGGGRRGAGGDAGISELARGVALAPHGALLPHPRARRRAARRHRPDPHRRAREGPFRREGGG